MSTAVADFLSDDIEITRVDGTVLLAEVNNFLQNTLVDDHYEIGIEPTPVLFRQINAFPDAQTRQIYENIDDLKESIKSDNLFHPLIVAKLSAEDAATYLTELNNMWGTQHSIEDQAASEDGDYFVLIAGHRRLQAIEGLLSDVGAVRPDVDLSSFMIRANIFEDLSLTEALKLQIAENTHQGLPPEQEAHSIRLYKERSGLTVRECSRDLGFSEAKVREAIRFTELPIVIQDCVHDGRISYSRSLALWHLQHAYRSSEDEAGNLNFPEQAEITTSLLIVVSSSIEKKWSTATYNDHIRASVAALTGGQEMLFTGYEDPQDKQLSDLLRSLANIGAAEFSHIIDLVERRLVKDPFKLIEDENGLKNIKEALQRIDRILRAVGQASAAELVDTDEGPPQDTSLFA